ncbi:MAG: hypothetical protein GWN62_27095 [Aliifodinibius sp.]|nr:hypothetical protein [Fodinibius sp.]
MKEKSYYQDQDHEYLSQQLEEEIKRIQKMTNDRPILKASLTTIMEFQTISFSRLVKSVVFDHLENKEDFDIEIKQLLELIDNLQREDIVELLEDEMIGLTERGKVLSEYLHDLDDA